MRSDRLADSSRECVPLERTDGTNDRTRSHRKKSRKPREADVSAELASALFSIADANEFRFARFYIVCEAVPLGTLESPLIVCGLPDTLRECSNVEETRNQMQPSGRKNCTHFFSTNVPQAFHPKSVSSASCNITYRPKVNCPPDGTASLLTAG